jgi:hypothetical protein
VKARKTMGSNLNKIAKKKRLTKLTRCLSITKDVMYQTIVTSLKYRDKMRTTFR